MRILVVDDDALNRVLLVHMLEQQGYVECYEAENGYQALSLAQTINPDLILLDILMPVMDGYEAAPQLKSLAGDAYLPIIFISSVEDEEALARCLEVGGDDFVSKPFDKIILSAKIRAHARTRQLSKKIIEQNQQLFYYQNAVEREHKIVEHIFANALTVEPGMRAMIDFVLEPASDFSGDMFLTRNSPSGGLYFLIGDFTGHGLAAAIGALPVAKAFHTMSSKGLSVMEMAETLNSTVLQFLPEEMFFAAILVEINHTGKRLDVWNGGMPDMILQSEQGKIVKKFSSKHMALGILDKKEFECNVERYEAQYNDRLVGFSDGAVEVMNQQGQMLTDEGIESWLVANPLGEVKSLMSFIDHFAGAKQRKDDVTLVIYSCQALKPISRVPLASALPFKFELNLDHHLIKSQEPIRELIGLLTNQLGLYGIHSDLFTILSELYNNAVDHGILELDSNLKKSDEGFFDYFNIRQKKLQKLAHGLITIRIDYLPLERSLNIQVSDSGKGFDPSMLKTTCGHDDPFGRGLPMLRELCHSIAHTDAGSTVNVVFKL